MIITINIIVVIASADEDIDSTFPTNVVVSSDGGCLWVPPGMFLSTCKIDISWFPFDDQLCAMKFGSWTYDSTGIDLQLDGDDNSGDTSSFISNGEWQLIGQIFIHQVHKRRPNGDVGGRGHSLPDELGDPACGSDISYF